MGRTTISICVCGEPFEVATLSNGDFDFIHRDTSLAWVSQYQFETWPIERIAEHYMTSSISSKRAYTVETFSKCRFTWER